MAALAGAILVLYLLVPPLSKRAARRSDAAQRSERSTGLKTEGEDDAGAKSSGHATSPAWQLQVLVLHRNQPVNGARVELFDPDQQRSWARIAPRASQPVAHAQTDAEGRATLAVRTAGRWNVVAKLDGLATGRVLLTLRDPVGRRDVTLHLRRGWTLTGRVLDERGETSPGATVTAGRSLHGLSLSQNVSARTDAAGRYQLSGLAPGRLQVAAGDPPGHFVTVVTPYEGDCDLVLRRRGALEGQVTDAESNRPIAGARLRIEARGSIGHCVTDDDGRYRCDGLRPTEVFRIAVKAEGYVPLHPSGVVGPKNGSLYLNPAGSRHAGRVTLAIPIAAGAATNYDIALRKGARVTGTVRGPDGPIAGAQIDLLTNLGQNGYLVAPVRSDGEGRYSLDGVLEGPVLVRPSKDGYYDPHSSHAFWHAALQGRREAPNRVVVPRTGVVVRNLKLLVGVELRGTIRCDGAPVSGAAVHAHQPQPLDRHRQADSVADGSFVIRGLIPGRPASVWAGIRGYAPSVRHELEVAPNMAPLQLELVALPRVRGRVTDERGKPVADASVLVVQKIAFSVSAEPLQVLTDADGRYERPILGLEDGFQIEIRAPGFPTASSDMVAIIPGTQAYEVDVELDRGATLRGLVRAASGEPVAGALIRVGRHNENPYSWHVPIRGASRADGTFEVRGVPTPKLKLFVSAPGYRPVQRTVELEEEAVVTLAPTKSVTGVVHRRDGTAAAGVPILAYPASGKRFDFYFVVRPTALRSDGIPGRAQATTDAQGRFKIVDLGDGAYRLMPAPGSGLRATDDVVVQAGSSGSRLTVEPADEGEFGTLTVEDAGRAARYLAFRGDHAKAIDVWRALLARKLDAGTRVTALIELGKSLAKTNQHEEWERVAREAATLAPATTAPGLFARYELARAILARGRPEEALTVANEVAAGKSVDAHAAARGDLAAVLALIELDKKDAARARLDPLGDEAARLKDASLQVLIRNAIRELNRKR